MDLERRLDVVEQENELLRARVRELEALLCAAFEPPFEWRLTVSEVRIMGVLLARPIASKDAMMAALYRDAGKDEAEIKIVDVFICKLRRKLRPFGIDIHTHWGAGYSLDDDVRTRLRSVA